MHGSGERGRCWRTRRAEGTGSRLRIQLICCHDGADEVEVRDGGANSAISLVLPGDLSLGAHAPAPAQRNPRLPCRLRLQPREAAFTSTEVVYGVTGTEVTRLPEYGVSP